MWWPVAVLEAAVVVVVVLAVIDVAFSLLFWSVLAAGKREVIRLFR